MKKILAATFVAIIVLVALLQMREPRERADYSATLPWNVSVNERGQNTVFGITLGQTSLLDIRHILNKRAELALMESPAGQLTLEIYYSQVRLGLIEAKMVGIVDMAETELTALKAAHPQGKAQPSGARKHMLTEADIYAVQNKALKAINLVPVADLDEELVLKRFGSPGEKVPSVDNMTHWLYPEIGVDIILNPDGKDMIQYFLPRNLDEIRQSIPAPVSEPSA